MRKAVLIHRGGGASISSNASISTGGNVTIQFFDSDTNANDARSINIGGTITGNTVTIESKKGITGSGGSSKLITANRVVMTAKSYGYDFVTNSKLSTSHYAIYVTGTSGTYATTVPTGATAVANCDYPNTTCGVNDLTSGKWIVRPGTTGGSPSFDALATMTVANPPVITGLSNQNKTFGDANFSLIPTSTSGGAFTYSSSDTAVATVNSSTGQVTIVGAGTATITATQAADATYSSGSATYTVTVANANPIITGLSNQNKTVGDSDFSLIPTSTSGGAFTYSSSDTAVATVNSSGVVTIVGAGTATITATQAAASNYNLASSSYTLTVAPAAVVASNTQPLVLYPRPPRAALPELNTPRLININDSSVGKIAQSGQAVDISLKSMPSPSQETAKVKSESSVNPSNPIVSKNITKENKTVTRNSISAKPTALNNGNSSASRGPQSISVALERKPSVQQTGIVSVSVPKEMATFSFTLPKEVAPKTPDKITLATGEPLPSWLVFSKKSNMLIASSVPNEAWPIEIRVASGATSTIIRIYKDDLQR